jgi:hypothetical protein
MAPPWDVGILSSPSPDWAASPLDVVRGQVNERGARWPFSFPDGAAGHGAVVGRSGQRLVGEAENGGANLLLPRWRSQPWHCEVETRPASFCVLYSNSIFDLEEENGAAEMR